MSKVCGCCFWKEVREVSVMKFDAIFDSNLADMKKVIKLGGTKSMSRAINESLAKGKTRMNKLILSMHEMERNDVKEHTRVVKCYPGNLEKGCIEAASRRLTSFHFPFEPGEYTSQAGIPMKDRPKAAITIKKEQKKALPHAFIVNPAKLKNNYTILWRRKGKDIMPIRTISIAQMASSEKVSEQVMNLMEETYQKRIVHHLNRQFKVEE